MQRTAAKLGYAVFVAVLVGVPLVAPQFWVTLGNYVGLYSIVALGLVLLTGVAGQTSFGQAAFVGIGAYTTAVLSTHYALSPWINLGVGLVLTLALALLSRAHHAADEGPLPAAGDDCLGHQPRAPVRQPRIPRRPYGIHRHSRAQPLRPRAAQRALLLFPDLGHRARRALGDAQSARFAARARRPRAARPYRDGRGVRRRRRAAQDRRVRLRGTARVASRAGSMRTCSAS